jgi:Fe-S-cluster-containing dehydrogenase component
MTTYGMLIDIDRCTGCYNCFLSCRDEYSGNNYEGYSAPQPKSGQYWMNIKEVERGTYPKLKVDYIPIPCMQCKNAPCEKAALNGAVYRRDDGIVMIDPEKAKGQKQIAAACPYRVIYWNEELDTPQKCTFCAHGLDHGWKAPRCVESCPVDAIVFGDLDDPDSEITKLKDSGKYERLNSEYALNTRVQYKNLPKRFIAGEVVFSDQLDECAQDVQVTLKKEGKVITTSTTNVYGDFEFDGLEKNSDYSVLVEQKGYASTECAVSTKVDVNLGEVELKPE